MNNKVSVIIPTYRERDNIGPLMERLHQALSRYDYEVVFVDDDSGDGTAELVSVLAEKYPVKIVVRRNQRGLATAVVAGLEHVAGQAVVVMDADLQHPPEVIPDLVHALDSGADIAIASRYIPGGGCQGWGLSRKIVSRGAIVLAHLFLPVTRRIKDPLSGFFAFKRPVVARAKLKPTGYKIILEILIMGESERVTEVPFVFRARSRGESKLSPRQQVDYLRHVYSLMQRTGELWRFLKFGAVGLSGILVNMGLLWALTTFAGLPYQVSAVFSIESSIISNFTLNDFFTFADRRSPGVRFMTRLLKFNLVSMGGVAVNYGVLLLLTEVGGLYYLLSNLVGIVVAFLWNYLLNTWWTWQ